MLRMVVAMTCLVSACVAQGGSTSPSDHATTFTSSCDGSTQPFRLFVPRKAQQTTSALPLMIVLHGWGVNQNTWFDFTPVKAIADRYGYVVAAPYGRGNWWYRGPAERDVLDIIDDVKKRCNVDPDRVYLAGHSMGGWGTWWVGLRNPDRFAAIAPMSGFPPDELTPNARNLAPFIIHDSLDDIVPVTNSRGPAERLAQLGISFQYREESEYAHASRLIGDNLPRVLEWFDQHPRAPRPRKVSLVTRTPAAASAQWLRILELSRYPDTATLEGALDTSGNLQLNAEGARRVAVDLSSLPTSASEPLRIIIDARTFDVPIKSGWAILTARTPSQWTFESVQDCPAPAPVPVMSGPVADLLREAATDQDRLATNVAELLRKACDAEICVLDPEVIHLAPGELTGDMVMDLFTYPDQRLARFACTSASLARARGILPNRPVAVYADNTTTLPTTRDVMAIMPAVIAKRFPEYDAEKQILPNTIGRILYDLCTSKEKR